ncbi:hypothetical protein PLA107_003390 [Pseudomonas amygdali pv. lachrymans str. M301315]|uniref:Uncharacterized protein n=1 Tax=Pseudomonas amygdali pv. lachrymans str. M301315 TaxID=629260 RepID=A0AAD0PR24_PSEAV|nr:hypothetical protein PLA107_003390 [Pseudomonas amygdali pv. lachrymans str. M301315]PWD01797.1 hypothetical protein CX658_17645 [Pseudomonas amygdali pv. lachrymans]
MGANLFAKALFLTIHLQRMYRPFREQCGSPPRSLPQVRIPTNQPTNQSAIICPLPPSARVHHPAPASSGGTSIRPAAAARGMFPA